MRTLKTIIFRVLVLSICLVIVSCSWINDNIQQRNSNSSSQGSKGNTPTSEPLSPTPIAVEANNIIGSFTTELLDNGNNRVKNISISAEEIDGYILEPGYVFSFNDIVGTRTPTKGYKKAKILIKGEVDWSEGGGICQLSSTIYNAAMLAGMTIIERHSHSAEVGYVAKGQDAAVNYGSMDFKFKNSKEYAVIIDVNVNNNKVYASIVKKV